MSNYQSKIEVLTPYKAAPFVVIAKKVVESTRSVRAAAEALGVSRTVVHCLVENAYLTDKQARNILSGWRRIKAAGATA